MTTDATRAVLRVLRLARARASLGGLLRGYLAFAAAHMLFKAVTRLRLWLRARRLLGHLPGASFSLLGFDWFGIRTLRNFSEYHRWRCEPTLERPGEGLVAGFGPFVEVFVNNRDNVKHVLKDDFDAFTKPAPGHDYLFQLLHEFLGPTGIFVIQHGKGSGDKGLEESHKIWFAQRKTASKIFTRSTFSSHMLDTFLAKGQIMRQKLKEQVADSSQAESPVDMQEMFFRFTFDSIQAIFFGHEVDTISGRDTDEYAKAYDTAHRAAVQLFLNHLPIHIAAQMALPFPFGTLGTASSGWSLPMALIRRFSAAGREFSSSTKFLHRSTLELVKKTRADPGVAKRSDLLANFINSGAQLSDEDLCSVVLHFIIAGRDTTACTLSWLFHELTRHPQAQDQIAAEVEELCGDEPLTFALIQQLPFLTACVYEALRLHPPVPEDYKMCTRDSVFPDNTVVPAGTKVVYTNFSMGRNPTLYEDPDAFKPSRWLDESGQLATQELDTYYTPVFQAGYRECLGKQMALLEVRALAATLLRSTAGDPGLRFTADPDELEKVTWSLMVTMSICNSPARDSFNLWLKPRLAESTQPR